MGLLDANDYYVLLEVFILLAVAQILRASAKQVGVPEVVADLLAGMLIGSFALGGVVDGILGIQLFAVNSGLLLFADLSVVLLLFGAGLGGGFSSLRRAGPAVLLAAVAGDLAAFGLVLAVFSRFYSLDAALLIAIAAAPTSTVVVASLLEGTELERSRGAQFLMNAAALDDVVALALLSVALAFLSGRASPEEIVGSAATSLLGWVVLLLASILVLPNLLKIPPLRRADGLPFAMLFGLIAVVLALGFSPVIGAYIAGLAIAESPVAARTRDRTAFLVAVFGSLFFIVVGAEFDPRLLTDPVLVAGALLLTGLAVLGKIAGVLPFARQGLHDVAAARVLAIGMVPRGEIGLIVGALGFGLGILTQTMLGEVLVMSMATTLVGAYLFRRESAALTRSDPAPPVLSGP